MAKSHRALNFTANGAATDVGTAVGHWNGWGVNSRLRAIYDLKFGSFYLRPQVGVDFLQLNESAYTESGGGVIDAAVGSRKTSQFSGFAGAAGGARFGTDTAYWGPELLVGYRDAFSTSDGSTTARYLAGGDAFTLAADPIGKGGLVARFALRNENGDSGFSLEAGGETRSHFTEVDLKLSAHVSF
jgi:outer membrane autotransporter protein